MGLDGLREVREYGLSALNSVVSCLFPLLCLGAPSKKGHTYAVLASQWL